jgi:WD40 repeat protein
VCFGLALEPKNGDLCYYSSLNVAILMPVFGVQIYIILFCSILFCSILCVFYCFLFYSFLMCVTVEQGQPLEASFSPDSQFVLGGSTDGKIHIWRTDTGQR